MIRRIGVIGLGDIGAAIASTVAEAGYNVTAFDVDDAKFEAVADSGVDAADTPRELAKLTDCVLIAVGTDDQIESVLFGKDGVGVPAVGETIVCVCSTTSPYQCTKWTDRLPDGIEFIDTPIARGPFIESHDAVVFIGGPEAVVQRVKPVFGEFATKVTHLGDVGSGQMAKLANNQIFWSCHLVTYEAFLLADHYGLDVEQLLDVFPLSSGDNYALRRWHEVTGGRWASEDLEYVLDIAAQLDLDLPLTTLIAVAFSKMTVPDLYALEDTTYSDR